MKRSIFLGIILALALGACGGGNAVGNEGITDFTESDNPSLSPTPSASKTTPKKSATPTPTPTATRFDYCTEFKAQEGGNLTVVIRTTAESFEPNQMFILRGCKITFKNLDAERAHSFVSGSGTDQTDGDLWKSPPLKKGDKPYVVDTTDIEAGRYPCHDGEVPYGVVCEVIIQDAPE